VVRSLTNHLIGVEPVKNALSPATRATNATSARAGLVGWLSRVTNRMLVATNQRSREPNGQHASRGRRRKPTLASAGGRFRRCRSRWQPVRCSSRSRVTTIKTALRYSRVDLLCLLFSLACGGRGASPPSAQGAHSTPRYYKVPPKPGASITASVKCECYACDPASCCGGGSESTGDEECSTGYDFSRCNMALESCTTRCFQKVWRVPQGESCESRRPEECCAGG
jgi:hypothetical protein